MKCTYLSKCFIEGFKSWNSSSYRGSYNCHTERNNAFKIFRYSTIIIIKYQALASI